MAAVNKIIDSTFPEENFEETKKKVSAVRFAGRCVC